MRCMECDAELQRLVNDHLLACCGLTLQEYAIRHHTPLDLLLHADQINERDDPDDFPKADAAVGEDAREVLEGLRLAGLLHEEHGFTVVPGEVRRLDQLLWDLTALRAYGFRFRQEYHYSAETHRVVARNRLKAPSANLQPEPAARLSLASAPDFKSILAVFMAHVAELHAGYLFLPFATRADGEAVLEQMGRDLGVGLSRLDAADSAGGVLLRTRTRDDTQRLLELMRPHLEAIPHAPARFFEATPQATVVKELVFDAAHFITDHPAKCSNLHGGRYLLHVKVRDRIDPISGCVVDYGYLKRVATRRVVERFDHHSLNYAAAELAWRSSTEMLCVYIWEQLIDYLPGLEELTLYETTQSWCNYRGPSLEQMQAEGPSPLLRHFHADEGARSDLREQLREAPPRLRAVAQA